MKIVCSWCRGEGRVGLVGEKAPLEDRRETHGICLQHQIIMRDGGSTHLCQTTETNPSIAPISEGGETLRLTRFYRLVLTVAHIRAGLKHFAWKTRL